MSVESHSGSDEPGFSSSDESSNGPTFLGHPRGLMILFFTELWERFSYYGMRALLILYLTQHFLFSDERSTIFYGAYTALVYVMTIVGGSIADRYLGARKAVTFGAVLLVIGHSGMALEGSGSRQIMEYEGEEYVLGLDGRGGDANQMVYSENASSRISFGENASDILIEEPEALGLPAEIPAADYSTRIETEPFYVHALYLSLAFIIAGVGFLKANISSIVGSLYQFGDNRRDSGFTIFYMGINMGAFIAPLICGYLGITYGWRYGFGLAGIGMLVGLVMFLRYQYLLGDRGEAPDPQRLKEKVLGPVTVEMLCYLGGLGIVALSYFLVGHADVVREYYVGLLGIVIFVLLVGYAFIACKGEERDRMLAGIYFVLAQIPFWALFEQAGSSLNLFTDRMVDRTLFGFSLPAPMFQSLNALFIIMFAPIMAWLWVKLSQRGWNPSAPVKFALGVFMAGLGFLALVGGMLASGEAGLTAMYFIVLIYWIHTIGELMVSPVGLSAVTKLAPLRAVGMTMGAWFLYTGLSNYLAGVIASSTGAETIGGQITNAATAKATYVEVYSQVGYIAMAIAAVMLLISPVIKKMMRGAE